MEDQQSTNSNNNTDATTDLKVVPNIDNSGTKNIEDDVEAIHHHQQLHPQPQEKNEKSNGEDASRSPQDKATSPKNDDDDDGRDATNEKNNKNSVEKQISPTQAPSKKQEQETVLESVSLPPSMWMASKEIDYEVLGPTHFEKLRLLGRGDVGKVYLARLRGTEELYAIKVLQKEEMIRRNKIKRVLTEREILVTTDHPFIVSLYATFQSTEKLYYVMEYCAGGEMFRLLQKQPKKVLPEHVVRFYAAEVLLALEYLHLMGYIYRDLKPENILIHESGHIRLTDFDLSKSCSNAPLNPKVVQSMFASMKTSKIDTKQVQQFNSFVGTEEYIAPEVITGFGHSSTVDWWTFGILIYELLYGGTPFKGTSQKETFSNILNKKLKFNDSKNPVSRNGKDLIKRLLVSDQKKRLGHKNGAADIKSHPFFKGINWALIRNEKPPIVPHLRDKYDTSHFRNMYDSDNEEDIPLNETEEKSLSNPFREFRYISSHRDAYGHDRKDDDTDTDTAPLAGSGSSAK